MKILKVRTYWSASEAEGICQSLDALKEEIWSHYGYEIYRLYDEKRQEKMLEENGDKLDSMDNFEDDIPF
jgi:hypothetical protein